MIYVDLYFYLCCFLIYAFLGWCAEVSFAAVNQGKFVNRGFLNGPVCPIYGAGMVIIIYFLTPLQENTLVLFLGSVVLTSALEWVTGFVLEKLFHQKWWDYSELPFNLNGYICLKFSLMWGFACLIIMDAIQPMIAGFIRFVPGLLGHILLGVLLALLLADCVVTVRSILKLNKRLGQLEEVARRLREVSDDIGENLYTNVTSVLEKREELKEDLEAKKEALDAKKQAVEAEVEAKKEALDAKKQAVEAEVEAKKEALEQSMAQKREAAEAKKEALRQQMQSLLEHKEFGHGRLLKAFPGVKSERYAAALKQLKAYMQYSEGLKKENRGKDEKDPQTKP